MNRRKGIQEKFLEKKNKNKKYLLRSARSRFLLQKDM